MNAAVQSYLARWEADSQLRQAERVSRYQADPARYEARRAALGWSGDVPRGAEPAEPEMPVREVKLYEMREAITAFVLDMRYERGRSPTRQNRDERDSIKDALSPTFADLGLRLVKIANWSRGQFTLDPRLT